MITCVVEYVIDPRKTDAFEQFAARWMELVDAHEEYRTLFGKHPDFIVADRIRDESGCVLRYERSFMRPLLPGTGLAGCRPRVRLGHESPAAFALPSLQGIHHRGPDHVRELHMRAAE